MHLKGNVVTLKDNCNSLYIRRILVVVEVNVSDRTIDKESKKLSPPQSASNSLCAFQ